MTQENIWLLRLRVKMGCHGKRTTLANWYYINLISSHPFEEHNTQEKQGGEK